MGEVRDRLEELRVALREERISYGELAELQGLADCIEPGDVELLEAAGVPEQVECMRFALDVPNGHDAEGEWINYGYFETREEAVAAAKHHFGADDEGRIGLVSELPADGEEAS